MTNHAQIGGGTITSESLLAPTPRAFRECMGNFPTGVTVVLADGPNGPAGMTVNSFTSVSLSPMLVLVSLTVGSRTLEAVRGGSGDFTISVLSRSQEDVARDFGRSGADFPHTHVLRDDDGHPHVRGSLAYVKCRTYSMIRLGDHDLLVGEVKNFGINEGPPLVFHRGAYAMLGL